MAPAAPRRAPRSEKPSAIGTSPNRTRYLAMTESDDILLIARLAAQHGVSADAVRTILNALRSGGGSMAQFSHTDFGGMSQWSPGMAMVGDMFNNQLKSKLDAICSQLAAHIAETGPRANTGEAEPSYRSVRADADWWPSGLGVPGSVGAQNTLRYAVFPATQRLAIKDGHGVKVYDTGDHKIFGVAQAQSTDQTLTFTSQTGLVRVADLAEVGS
jgi:hypothetical protein